MNYCCAGFEGLIENAGKRGLSALAKTMGNSGFKIQARGIDFKDEGISVKVPFSINIVRESSLHYCFFCGVGLNDWIKNNKGKFEELGKQHEHLIQSKI